MKRALLCFASAFLPLLAYADVAPEAPVQSNPLGTIIFGVIFFGVCAVFGWMVWRNKGRDQKEEKK